MLKFFRKYMKYILAAMVSLLMIAFLVQPTMQMFTPDPRKRTLGAVGDESITVADQQLAGFEIDLLRRLGLPPSSTFNKMDPLAWTLIMIDARAMGLSVSNYEVDEVLKQLFGADESNLPALAQNLRVRSSHIQEAVRHWLIARRYEELVYGLSHVSLAERLAIYREAAAQGVDRRLVAELTRGRLRLSKPLVRRFLHDQLATVKIKAVTVSSARYLSQVKPPTEQDLVELFEQYKDNLPGEGGPYGLGYRFPDRVKIEYLAIPIDRLHEKVVVDEADALGFYEDNYPLFPVDFDPDAPEAPEPQFKPYEQVRDEIINLLRDRKAVEQGEQMLRTARTMLHDQARSRPVTNGYYDLPDDWSPTPLHQVTEQLQSQYGVLVDVVRDDRRWLDRQAVAALPGIGDSFLSAAGQVVSLAQYVLSTREITPQDAENALALLRLQTMMPSETLVSFEQTDSTFTPKALYLFRLIDARPQRSPQSLDEVRQQVTDDARRLAAYQKLLDDRQTWIDRLETRTLQEVAAELDDQVFDLEPFPKRGVDAITNAVSVPILPGIGQSESFVNAVFALAEQVVASAGVEGVAEAGGIGAFPLPQDKSLVLVKLEDYTPMTRSLYDTVALRPDIGNWINRSLQRDVADPMSLESLMRRTGFVYEQADGDAEEQQAPPPADQPES